MIVYEGLVIDFKGTLEGVTYELKRVSTVLSEWSRVEREAPDSLLWTLLAMLIFIPTIMLWVRG